MLTGTLRGKNMRKLHQIFENHYIVMNSNVVKRSKYNMYIVPSATLNADDVYTRNLRSVTYKTIFSV